MNLQGEIQTWLDWADWKAIEKWTRDQLEKTDIVSTDGRRFAIEIMPTEGGCYVHVKDLFTGEQLRYMGNA